MPERMEQSGRTERDRRAGLPERTGQDVRTEQAPRTGLLERVLHILRGVPGQRGEHASSDGQAPQPERIRRVAVITQGVRLPHETRGYTRFWSIAAVLALAGFEVSLITSRFQHWDKQQREGSAERLVLLSSDDAHDDSPQETPDETSAKLQIVLLDEPGYRRNIDPMRIRSHALFAQNLKSFLEQNPGFDLILSEIPPNDMARVAAEYAHEQGIPFVIDINDLWPEAMRMVLDLPFISKALYASFQRDADASYAHASALIATSAEYVAKGAEKAPPATPSLLLYVGNELADFDAGVREHLPEIAATKAPEDFWISYAGTLGRSYDLATLIRAVAEFARRQQLASERAATELHTASGLPDTRASSVRRLKPRLLILGDGPERRGLERLAKRLKAPVDFLGYREYGEMAAWLSASDVLINSLVGKAPQSIPTKIADYLAAGRPIINTGSSLEMQALLAEHDSGISVPAEDVSALVAALELLADEPYIAYRLGDKARALAEEDFDRAKSYPRIVSLVEDLLDKPGGER